ncbi:helix-turn-helix domain-containing protein [Streptomyces sp. 2RAF24]|uniref:helix-turn-helix domain-containing protein n=1 Tax=Streptomyces sp. 2RAF24 TaxID=3232997 RepID=UPI003F9A3CAD
MGGALQSGGIGYVGGDRHRAAAVLLRRDEAARLAGVRTEYYTRLEQGRAGNPSAEVVEAIARALRLEETEREHLTDLLRAGARAARRAPARAQRVRSGLHLMLQTLDHVPAYRPGSAHRRAGLQPARKDRPHRLRRPARHPSQPGALLPSRGPEPCSPRTLDACFTRSCVCSQPSTPWHACSARIAPSAPRPS